jgi:hypothetical protein
MLEKYYVENKYRCARLSWIKRLRETINAFLEKVADLCVQFLVVTDVYSEYNIPKYLLYS